MPPQLPKKRKSDALEAEHGDGAVTTPTGHPARKRMKISQPQKQALIDNLQLEGTSLLHGFAQSELMVTFSHRTCS
jgi:hypothetical protein